MAALFLTGQMIRELWISSMNNAARGMETKAVRGYIGREPVPLFLQYKIVVSLALCWELLLSCLPDA